MVLAAVALSSVAAAAPCYGWQLANHVEGAHLSVQWDDLIDQGSAEEYAAIGDAAWDAYVGLGFPPPVGAPSILFQVDPLGRGGYTDTVSCDGEFHPRMYVYLDDRPYSDATVAHELFHAVQYAYQPDVDFIANYYIWPWWAEGTAEWAGIASGQDPRTWGPSVSAYLATGWIALHQDATAFLDPERGAHMYGTALLAAYLAEVDSPQLIGDTFAAVQGHPSERAWFPDVIAATGRDWDALWDGYLAALPTVAIDLDTSQLAKVPAVSRTTALPAEGGGDPEHLPQGLGFAIHAFEASVGGAGDELRVAVDGDADARWHAVLVRTAAKRVGSRVLDTVVLEMGADGAGAGQIALDGEHPVYLVVSPEVDDDDGYAYTWSAERVAGEVEAPGCGCAAGAPPGAGVVALGVLWIGRRRARGWRRIMGIEPTERSLSTRPDRF